MCSKEAIGQFPHRGLGPFGETFTWQVIVLIEGRWVSSHVSEWWQEEHRRHQVLCGGSAGRAQARPLSVPCNRQRLGGSRASLSRPVDN